MKLFCIQNLLSRHFSKLGSIIAKHPYYFLFGTLILTSAFSVGLFRIKPNRDFNVLFTAINGRAQTNKKFVETIFPMNTTAFADIARVSEIASAILVQIIANDGGSVLRKNVIEKIVDLDKSIRNITIKWNNRIWNYKDLCGKRNGKCLESTFYNIVHFSNGILSGNRKIKYPIDIDNITYSYDEYAMSLGGVELDSNGNLKDAKAARFIYMLDSSDPGKKEQLQIWKKAVNKYLRDFSCNVLFISYFNDMCVIEEFESLGTNLINHLPSATAIVVIFSFFCCFTNNWIRSKPWLGPSACFSAGLAIISGYGLAGFIGIKYNDVHIGLCLIVFGTEIDDAFVLISAWRNSSVHENVMNRMTKVYSEAGLSITITSLTNLISFCVGCTSRFPIVQIFCGYAACCIFFTYIYQITFFGACMALSGYREEKKLHPLTFRPIKDNKAEERDHSEQMPTDKQEFLMAQFRNKIGTLLTFFKTKVIIIILVFINLAIGIYGFIHIKKGNEFSDLFSEDSSINVYYKITYKYFNSYYYPIHIVIDKPINYADENVQKSLEDVITIFESHPHTSDISLRISWLKYYKLFASMPVGKFSLKGYNISDKQDFIDGLRNVFLRFPQAKEFKQDIIFNENFTDIIASRFIIFLTDILNQNIEYSVIKDLYQMVDKSPIAVKIHSATFNLAEQALLIENIIYEIILISSALICIIFFLFVPNIICALSIAAVVLCIICETIGYVSFLNVKMDLLLLYSVVLCVGFSINYPSHISYCFVLDRNSTIEERIKASIYQIGLPIIQGTATTILSILMLIFEPIYSTFAFFKIMSVLSLQTVLHALFAMPIILSLFLYKN